MNDCPRQNPAYRSVSPIKKPRHGGVFAFGDGDVFPLTPALSPGEREKSESVLDLAPRLRGEGKGKSVLDLSPLPLGEG